MQTDLSAANGAAFHQGAPLPGKALVIVVGNEKGGSSKSTTAMHLFAALAARGVKVGVIDLDVRQKSLLRFLENRAAYAERRGVALSTARHVTIVRDQKIDVRLTEQRDAGRLREALAELMRDCGAILIDCPGSNTFLAQVAHSVADVLVTPVGASLVDFDLLAHYDAASQSYSGPSIYAETVWQARQIRQADGFGPLRWHVVLNRYPPGADVETLRVSAHLRALADRLGFTRVTGIAERPIYRDLFEHGLTVFDVAAAPDGLPHDAELAAATIEVGALLDALQIPALQAQAPGLALA